MKYLKIFEDWADHEEITIGNMPSSKVTNILEELTGKAIEFYSHGKKMGPLVLKDFEYYDEEGAYKDHEYLITLTFDNGKHFDLDRNRPINVLEEVNELYFDKPGSFQQMIPIAMVNSLNSYYSCHDCNALYKLFNSTNTRCKFCGSNNLQHLSEDEYYNDVEIRLEPDEIEDLRKEREEESTTQVDLMNLDLEKKRKIKNN